MEGGVAHFPGLAKLLVIETDDLPGDEAEELQRLVDSARFFDMPAEPGPPPRGAADYRRYLITVSEAGRKHTVRLHDPVSDPQVAALVERLVKRLFQRR